MSGIKCVQGALRSLSKGCTDSCTTLPLLFLFSFALVNLTASHKARHCLSLLSSPAPCKLLTSTLLFSCLPPGVARGGSKDSGACLRVRVLPKATRLYSLTLFQRQDGFRGNRRQSRVLPPLNPGLAAAGWTPSLSGAWCVHNCPLRLPACSPPPATSGWGGGEKGQGKVVADSFLDHVAASYNQSARSGVHPEDPAGALGNGGRERPSHAGLLGSACVFSPAFARSEAPDGKQRLTAGDLVVTASFSPGCFHWKSLISGVWKPEPHWTWTPKHDAVMSQGGQTPHIRP